MHTRPRLRVVRAVVALATALAPCALAAQPEKVPSLTVKPNAPAAEPGVVKNPVLITTFSGGISLGAYQAGVDWALLEFYRGAGRDPRFAREWRLPQFRFGTAAGASAGNINALLWAIETCTTQQRAQPPEQSLFWTVWTDVDVERLLPVNPRPGAELALLDRGFIDSLTDTIAARTRSGALARGCKRPLGLTLTRVMPETQRLGGIPFRSQRYVVPLVAGVEGRAEGQARRMVFTRPRVDDRRLGPVRHPLHGPDGREVPLDGIIPVVKASAAFPVAFAPVMLNLERGDAAPPAPEMFVDGGLFDNNPVDLALVLHRAVGLEPQVDTVTAPSPGYQLLYVDPDNPRPGQVAPGCPSGELGGKPPQCVLRTPRDPAPGGLRPVLRLLGGAFNSAREYELFALSRSLPADTLSWQLLTTRRHPVVGERMSAFAAFLNRAYREYDFYVGTYDAIHFVLCESPGREREPQRESSLCTYENALVLRDALPLSPAASRLVERLARDEFAPTPGERLRVRQATARVAAAGPDGAVSRVYESIFDALLHAQLRDTTARGRAESAACGRSLSWSVACLDGTNRFLARVRSGLLKADPSACGSNGPVGDAEMTAVLTRYALCDLMRRPEDEYFQVYFDRLMRRLVQVERDVDAWLAVHNASVHPDSAIPGGPAMQPMTEGLAFAYQSSSLRPHVGWHWGGMPAEVSTSWRLAPAYATVDAQWDGADVGWAPVWYSRARPGVGLAFPFGVRWNNPAGHGEIPHWYYMAGAKVVARNRSALWSLLGTRVEAGVLYFQPGRDLWEGRAGGTVAAEATATILADRLRIGVRRSLTGDPVDGLSRVQWSLGFNDVNGLGYWVDQIFFRR
ncbi:patatin-like phospholipase family protein [Longimicrobium sp.]|uniref:patatin-like phospholipase family protein n=1 Tax=Longimicrobium sp. TaxID=2029185 RepID=UPI002E36630A|nr:patatin-like phospholipase family protein [Longimicrobium sp.]HEX6040426.1 patatin-like phospholipase family protein [Longimicrobium sp.]